VREVCLQVLGSGAPVVREYCSGNDEIAAWDLGVGCEGSVLVHVGVASGELRVANSDWVAMALARMDAYVPFALCVDLVSGDVGVVDAREAGTNISAGLAALARMKVFDSRGSGVHTVGGREVFIDVLTPPPQLVIVSAGEDARHLARFATDVGFRVVVVDRRPGLLIPDRFPRGTELVEADASRLPSTLFLGDATFAVVMNHNYADDREYLRMLLDTPVRYIGMLGPRQRTDRIISELSATGPIDEQRIFGPVGLDIGTDGAEQVALAIIAEILAVRSGRRPASLRDRRQPIHANATG
jgi:xanthine dehydrogenase accessory factor